MGAVVKAGLVEFGHEQLHHWMGSQHAFEGTGSIASANLRYLSLTKNLGTK